MRILLSGGGTGGHITPILAIVKAIKQLSPETTLYYIGEQSELTDQLLNTSDIHRYHIIAGKFRRYPGEKWYKQLFDYRTHWLNLLDVFKVGASFFQSLGWLIKIRPHCVFVKGGYVGLPVGLAAKLLQMKLVIHESDAKAGLTNRILGYLADYIATGFPVEYYPRWHNRALYFTGNPIRKELFKKPAKLHQIFNLDARLKTILIIGGSRGARAINLAVMSNLDKLLEKYQLIHLVGQRDFKEFTKLLDRSKLRHERRYHPYEFLDQELGAAYHVASLVISRAGMNTISEIAAFKKPVIVIPHPTIANGHQLKNAEVLAELNAASVLSQTDLDNLPQEIDLVLGDRSRYNQLKRNINRFANLDAAEQIAKIIIKATK